MGLNQEGVEIAVSIDIGIGRASADERLEEVGAGEVGFDLDEAAAFGGAAGVPEQLGGLPVVLTLLDLRDVFFEVAVGGMISDGMIVSVSVAELLPGVGSLTPPAVATVAVLTSEPVAATFIAATAVYITDPPAGRLTVSLILPEPEAVQVPPPAARQVGVAPVFAGGNVYANVEPGGLLGAAVAAMTV